MSQAWGKDKLSSPFTSQLQTQPSFWLVLLLSSTSQPVNWLTVPDLFSQECTL